MEYPHIYTHADIGQLTGVIQHGIHIFNLVVLYVMRLFKADDRRMNCDCLVSARLILKPNLESDALLSEWYFCSACSTRCADSELGAAQSHSKDNSAHHCPIALRRRRLVRHVADSTPAAFSETSTARCCRALETRTRTLADRYSIAEQTVYDVTRTGRC